MKKLFKYSFIFLFIWIALPFISQANSTNDESLAKLIQLERDLDGRLGVFALNTSNGAELKHRANERFPIASTFKALLGADILAQSVQKPELMKQPIKYDKSQLVFHSPITEKHVEGGMTVAQLLDAMMRYSDNTATNLLMKLVGGPAGVTKFAHSIGNREFRLAHWEVDLNRDDVSTPEAMGRSLQKLVLGDFLPPSQRKQLEEGLCGNTVAAGLIRAGVPANWKVGDRSGGMDGIRNDIAVIWPPNRAPIILSIYTHQSKKGAQWREDILASATRVVVEWVQQQQ